MEGANSSRALRVTDAAAAAILADPERWQFLAPFLGRENTLSGAAGELRMPLHTVKYRVSQMVEAGLLRVTREQARAGRPIRHYRSTADAFFVPYSAMPSPTLEDYLYESDVNLQRSFAKALARTRGYDLDSRGKLFHNEPEGCARVSASTWFEDASEPSEDWRRNLAPDEPAVMSAWAQVELTREDAKRLQHLLADFLTTCTAGKQERGWPYLLRLGLVPLPVDD
jgi:hypothetical protein